MNKKITSSILLVIVALIWGFAFVAQSKGMEYIGPYTFSMARSFIGGAFLFILMLIAPKFVKLDEERTEGYFDQRLNLKAGIVAGIVLFLAMNFQQIGLKYTTPGKAGFITTLYIVIIPIIRKFKGDKLEKKIIFCVLLALIGMYLISVKEDFSINVGDIIVFISAIFYSIHTLVLSNYSVKTDGLRLNLYQFIFCGILSGVFALIAKENINIDALKMSLVSILYVGVLSSGFAYTLQIIALRHIDPTIAALLNSLESIFAVLGGFLILGQVLTKRELIGCIIMFSATIIAQIPNRKERHI